MAIMRFFGGTLHDQEILITKKKKDMANKFSCIMDVKDDTPEFTKRLEDETFEFDMYEAGKIEIYNKAIIFCKDDIEDYIYIDLRLIEKFGNQLTKQLSNWYYQGFPLVSTVRQ